MKKVIQFLKVIFCMPVYALLGVAAPQYASMTILYGNNLTLTKDLYCSDVDKAHVTWDSGAGASTTSPTDFDSPVDGKIIDFSIKTGMTDTTHVRVVLNGQATHNALRYENHLNTSYRRNPLAIPVNRGTKIALIQD